MNKNKSTLIIKILIILFIIILLIVGGLIVYLSTDLFKSNKTLFTKYAMQMLGKENSFIENDVINHYEKIMQIPFQNESTLSFNITGGDAQQAQRVSQTNVTLNGQVDVKNKSFDENLSINYSPEVTLPYELRMKNGVFGYKQEQYISSKFIVDDRNNTNTSGSNNNNTNNVQSITTEDVKAIFEKYGEIVFSNITDDKFSKEESDNNTTIYKLTLTNTDLNNIEKSVLETLKDDSQTIEKLGLDSSKIEDLLNKIENKNQKNSDETTEINLYKQNGSITKIEFKNSDINISLEKALENNNLKYKISIANEEGSLAEIELSYTGLSSQEVEENYSLQLNSQNASNNSSASNISYTLKNKVSFIDSSNIEDFNDNNAVIFSKYNEEQVESLSNSISERMTLVNEKQMEELGIDVSQNPLGIAISPLFSIYIFGQVANPVNNTALQQADISAFNQKFELYEGTNLQGTTVRGLLTTISNNNGLQQTDETGQENNSNKLSNNSYKIEEINFNGEEYEVNGQNIAALKDEVVADNYYRVEFEKDPNTGRIYRAVINQK